MRLLLRRLSRRLIFGGERVGKAIAGRIGAKYLWQRGIESAARGVARDRGTDDRGVGGGGENGVIHCEIGPA